MNETAIFDLAGSVAPDRLAAEAARDVLIEGGNAIEAAVAAAALSAVLLPWRNGLGGDGLWIVREAGARGRGRCLDARGPAAALATPAHFRSLDRDDVPAHGLDAILTVPGAVAGWRAAFDLAGAIGGKMPVARLLEPAVAQARRGITVSAAMAATLAEAPADLCSVPGFAARFLDDGKPPAAEGLQTNPALAETLAYLAASGLDDFYRGDVAREIVAELAREEHLLRRDDLRGYEARWRQSQRLDLFKSHLLAPPTRIGSTLLVALGLFDRLKPPPREGFALVHGLIEALGAAGRAVDAADRAIEPVPLLEPSHLDRAVQSLDGRRAGPPLRRLGPQFGGLAEASLWIGVIDGSGLAVSLVQSLGSAFGSGVVSARTGVLLGNRGAGFALDAARGPLLRPGRRAPMGAVPVVLAQDDGRVASFGAEDESVAAQLVARMRLGSGAGQTVAAPRFAPRFDRVAREAVLDLEEGFDPSVVTALRRAGHPVAMVEPQAVPAGAILQKAATNGRIEAVPDPRGTDTASGF